MGSLLMLSSASSDTKSYSYADNTGHTSPSWLTGESGTRLSSYSQSSSYDSAGNPTNFTGSSNSFNADNQNTANSYDGDGNPTIYGSATCAFDEENRATSLGTALTAGYDGDGLRAWKNNGTVITYFLYDGIQPVCELNGSGTITATNTFGGHRLVSRNASSATTFYTFDPQGGVAQRLNASDAVGSTDAYNAWGSRTSTGSGDVFTYGAQWGYYTDGETGLVLCGHRYYDPAHGRWLTRDPIGYAGGVDLYGYCQNNAIKYADPQGKVSILDCIVHVIVWLCIGALWITFCLAALSLAMAACIGDTPPPIDLVCICLGIVGGLICFGISIVIDMAAFADIETCLRACGYI